MDPLTGWYETKIEKLDFVARSARGTFQSSPALNTAPGEIQGVMTNPLIFKTDPANPESAILVSGYYDPNIFRFAVSVDAAQKILFKESEQALVEGGSKCLINLQFKGDGKAVTDKHTITVQGKELATLGRIEMNINRLLWFTGDCEQELNRMMWCYKDIKACELQGFDQKRQTLLQNIFGPYVQAGVMTEDDIANISEFGYDAVYR